MDEKKADAKADECVDRMLYRRDFNTASRMDLLKEAFLEGYRAGHRDGQADATRRETPPDDEPTCIGAALLGGRE